MTLEVCGDGRFEIIEKAKQAIIESTNIETSPEEMAVLDNILFRCWQMGWLDKYSNQAEQVTGKLNNPDDSLLTADSEACKEQKSKLDLISRQDAIRKCCEEKCGCEREDCGYTECCSEVSRLEQLPSAPDRRQRGEWYRDSEGTWSTVDFAYCSECKQPIIHKHASPLWNFCPNCGCLMTKGD